MRRILIIPFVLATAGASAMANEPGYNLRLESKVEGSTLTVVPHIDAATGARLRYEMVSSKQGSAGKSNTSQSGTVTVGPDGSAKLSTLSLGLGPSDRYVITVKVYAGVELVAQEVLRYPQ